MKEKELEFHSIVFQELDVVCPVGVLFTGYLEEGTVCLVLKTIANHNESLFHENFIVFFITNQSDGADGHKCIC